MMTFIVPSCTLIASHLACFKLMVGRHRQTLENSKIQKFLCPTGDETLKYIWQ